MRVFERWYFGLCWNLRLSYRVIISLRILVFLEDLFEDHIFCMVKYLSFSIILSLPYDTFQCKWQGHTETHPLVFLFCHIEISKSTITRGLLRSLTMVVRKQWYITMVRSPFIWKMANNRQRTSSSLLVLHETQQFLEVSWTNRNLWFFHMNFFSNTLNRLFLIKSIELPKTDISPGQPPDIDDLLFSVQLQWVFLGQNAFSSSTPEWNKLIAFQMGWNGLSGEKTVFLLGFHVPSPKKIPDYILSSIRVAKNVYIMNFYFTFIFLIARFG